MFFTVSLFLATPSCVLHSIRKVFFMKLNRTFVYVSVRPAVRKRINLISDGILTFPCYLQQLVAALITHRLIVVVVGILFSYFNFSGKWLYEVWV